MKNSRNCVVRLNFFTKTCLTNNYFSRDPHFVILAWVQSWNIFEKLSQARSFVRWGLILTSFWFNHVVLTGFCLGRMQWHYIFTIHLTKCHCHKHLSQVAITNNRLNQCSNPASFLRAWPQLLWKTQSDATHTLREYKSNPQTVTPAI